MDAKSGRVIIGVGRFELMLLSFSVYKLESCQHRVSVGASHLWTVNLLH